MSENTKSIRHTVINKLAHPNKEVTKQLGIFLIILGFITFTGLSIYITFIIDVVFGISALGIWCFITGSIICLIKEISDI